LVIDPPVEEKCIGSFQKVIKSLSLPETHGLVLDVFSETYKFSANNVYNVSFLLLSKFMMNSSKSQCV